MGKTKSSDHNLTEGSPAKLIIAFAVPMILGNLFQQLYNFVDTMIVGHFLGVDALAGVLEMIARTVAGIFFIPKFGFVGACVASPFAWLLADMFLIPAFFFVVKRLEKIVTKKAE